MICFEQGIIICMRIVSIKAHQKTNNRGVPSLTSIMMAFWICSPTAQQEKNMEFHRPLLPSHIHPQSIHEKDSTYIHSLGIQSYLLRR